jgi:sterol desaturase/sphingolipid hydroxylase (fatty acid hydroxylase superfamily)
MFCTLIEDVYFYWSHSTLHRPFFYKRFHKYHHEHKVPTVLACIHAHPVEFYFGNVLPELVGVILLANRVHHSCYYGWIVFRMMQSLNEHSGYNFTWSMFRLVPFHLRGDEHDYHHSENVGSYASFF